jgi:hypothetical protein
MMKPIPATRAILVAAGLVLATGSLAMAEEAASTAPAATEAPAAEREFTATIYAGPSIGYADQDSSQFGWEIQALARPIKWVGIQLEYWNLDHNQGKAGDFDGLYVGLMPILPLPQHFDLFGQIGASFGDSGDDVAAGGGVMYEVPIEALNKNNVDLLLRLDYKYFNAADGEHLVTFGFMIGFNKSK